MRQSADRVVAILLLLGLICLVLYATVFLIQLSPGILQQADLLQPAPTPLVTPTPTVPPTPAPSPPLPDRAAGLAQDLESLLLAPIWAFLRLVGLVGLLVLGVVLAVRLAESASISRYLVIPKFINATGEEALDSYTESLTLQFRVWLQMEQQQLSEVVKRHIQRQGPHHLPPESWDRMPLQSDSADEARKSFNELISTVTETLPEQYRPLAKALGVLIPPHGIELSGTLLHQGRQPGMVGITFRMAELSGNITVGTFEHWEARPNQIEPPSTPAPPDTATPANSPQAHQKAGEALRAAGQYPAAVESLQTALQLEPQSRLIAESLAATLAEQQTNEQRSTAFLQGQKLAASGLIEQAISAYLQALPADAQPGARIHWETVFDETRVADHGHAYAQLARLYQQAHLLEQAIELGAAGATRGSKTAAQEQLARLQDRADHLERAAERFYDLGRLQHAEKYVRLAIDSNPDHAGAVKLLASLHLQRPMPDNTEARASFFIGRIYQENQEVDKACEHYAEALKKYPDFGEAQQALKDALAELIPAHDRLQMLLQPMSRQLAMELLRREMLAALDKRYDRLFVEWQREKARIHNFMGALYQASALSFPEQADEFFYQALQDLEKAIRLNPGWFIPYENMADTYVYQGKQLAYDAELARMYFLRAVSYYQEAIQRKPPGEALRRVRSGKAIAQLWAGNNTEAREEIGLARHGQDPAAITDRPCLHNLATWHALAFARDNQRMEDFELARRFLAYLLGRDRHSEYEYLGEDEDLKPVSEESCDPVRGSFLQLLFEVRDERIRNPGLADSPANDFRKAMENIMQRANWL